MKPTAGTETPFSELPVAMGHDPCLPFAAESAAWPGHPDLRFGWTLAAEGAPSPSAPEICFRLADATALTPICFQQVHGTRVVDLDGGTLPSLEEPPEADGWITTRSDVLGGVSVADCAPVFLRARRGFGLLHAGWRGVVAEILPAALYVIGERWKAPAAEVELILGPCIGPCCFEVSPTVALLFPPHVRRRHRDRWHIDLPGTLLHQWLAAGGRAGNFKRLDRCTVCGKPRMYSHRRQPGQGRNIAFAYRTG